MRSLPIIIFLAVLTAMQVSGQKGFEMRNQDYSVSKDKAVSASQRKLFAQAQKWLTRTENIKLVRFNATEGILEGEGLFRYENNVILENVFLSKDANLRTRGNIKYKIVIKCEEGRYSVEFTEFDHEAFYNRYGKISFERLLVNDRVPLNKCFEHTDWCNSVWQDMKEKSLRHVTGLWIEMQKTIK
jgi:hypothetical protein